MVARVRAYSVQYTIGPAVMSMITNRLIPIWLKAKGLRGYAPKGPAVMMRACKRSKDYAGRIWLSGVTIRTMPVSTS